MLIPSNIKSIKHTMWKQKSSKSKTQNRIPERLMTINHIQSSPLVRLHNNHSGAAKFGNTSENYFLQVC